MHFLYPTLPFHFGTIDPTFEAEANAIRSVGFSYSLISIEDLEQGLFKVRPTLTAGETIVYRGWMLNSQTYQTLHTAIEANGCMALSNLETYLLCHHIPNWYPYLTELTPETKFFTPSDNLELELHKLGWEGFFVKDFVKSLKTSLGSTITNPSQIATVIAEMQKFRGNIEGGLSIRQLEAILPQTEQRFFVINGQAFGSQTDPPAIVEKCIQRIDSPFFSVDVATRDDGQLRVVEIGDGQVSDLVGWEPLDFANAFKQAWD